MVECLYKHVDFNVFRFVFDASAIMPARDVQGRLGYSRQTIRKFLRKEESETDPRHNEHNQRAAENAKQMSQVGVIFFHVLGHKEKIAVVKSGYEEQQGVFSIGNTAVSLQWFVQMK